jgi:hypothetical protein
MKKKAMSSSSTTTAPSIFIEKTIGNSEEEKSNEFSIVKTEFISFPHSSSQDDMICSSLGYPSSLPADAGDYVDALVAAKKAKRSSRHYNPSQSPHLPLTEISLCVDSRVAFQSPYSDKMKSFSHFDIPQVEISFSSDQSLSSESTLPNLQLNDDDLLKLLE